MSILAINAPDATLARVRQILALEGTTGQAGEIVLSLTNQPGAPRLFQSAAVSVDGPYSVSVSTEDTFFLSVRAGGEVVVHVGPNTGTTARFTVVRIDAFEYLFSARETRYTFVEQRPSGGDTKLSVSIRWS